MSLYSRKEEAPQPWLVGTVVLLTWALMHTAIVVFHGLAALDGTLLGPDSYMRMVRVHELVEGWQWFDNTIGRANAPYGDTLHWTRPFDLLILLLALPATLLMETEAALYVAGSLVSPVLQLATALTLVWALRPLLNRETWFLPAVALFIQPCALAYSLIGRADHHALLLLVFVVVAGFMLRALCHSQDFRAPLAAGISAGFGMWISVEFLLVVGLCLAALGLPWLFGERDRAMQSKWYALALSAVLLLALLVERPLANVFDESYDKVSSAHFLLAAAVLLFWRAIESLDGRGYGPHLVARAALGIGGVSAIAVLLVAAHPLFFTGPMAGVDPRIVPIWLDRVLEMRSLMPTEDIGRFILYLGGTALIAVPFLLVLSDEFGSRRFFAHLFIALACLALTLVAARHLRFSGYAETAFVMAFAVVLDRFLLSTARIASDLLRGLLRGSFVALMLLGPVFVGVNLIEKPVDARDAAGQSLTGCRIGEVASYLESDPRWNAAPRTILAFMDLGPELLYRTRHRVIGTPYHRNGDGIFDGHRMLATGDLAAARALIRQRQIDLIVLCQSSVERRFYAAAHGEENLYARLDRGDPPGWLSPVDLPDGLRGTVALYRVLP